MQSSFEKFTGTLVSLMATAMSAAIIAFFIYTFWMGRVVDMGWQIGGQPVPPETYPFILLVLWTILQREKAHTRPRDEAWGKFWWWEDLIEAIFMVFFFAVTLALAITTGTNLTFILVLLGFFAMAAHDAYRNGAHRHAEGERPVRSAQSLVQAATQRPLASDPALVAGRDLYNLTFPQGSSVRFHAQGGDHPPVLEITTPVEPETAATSDGTA